MLKYILLRIEIGQFVASSVVCKNELQRWSKQWVLVKNIVTVSECPGCSWLRIAPSFRESMGTLVSPCPVSASHLSSSLQSFLLSSPCDLLPREPHTVDCPLSLTFFSLPVPFSPLGSIGQSPVSLKTIQQKLSLNPGPHCLSTTESSDSWKNILCWSISSSHVSLSEPVSPRHQTVLEKEPLTLDASSPVATCWASFLVFEIATQCLLEAPVPGRVSVLFFGGSGPSSTPLQDRGPRSAPQASVSRHYPWAGKIPWRREWQPTPVFLPGEFHEQRSLVGYSPQGCRVRQDPVTNTFTFKSIFGSC